MLKQQKLSKRGFTIIEVVLVLAIAGLIFLMVFLALPALQRSQRDTQRRNSLGEFRAQIIQYQSNNRGKVPSSLTDWQNLLDNYMNLGRTKNGAKPTGGSDDSDAKIQFSKDSYTLDDLPFVDPDGEAFYIEAFCDMNGDTSCTSNNGSSAVAGNKLLTWDDDKHKIYVYYHATCDGENAVYVAKDNTRLVAFRSKLEGAGVYCGNN